MKLSELFFQLSVGELSNLAIGNEGSGEMTDKGKTMVVNHTNSGLLALYSRFALLEKDLLIELLGNRTLYPLDARYAEMNTASTEPHKFIKDGLHDKFTNDVIQITSVQDFSGYEYPLNDIEGDHSLFTPQPNILQVPKPKAGVALSVGYRARHPIISLVPETDPEIELPFFFEDALKKYIASQVFSNMVGQDHMVKSQESYAAYEAICDMIEEKDLASQTISTTNTVFDKRGFI